MAVNYLARGDVRTRTVERCVFAHFAVDNIRDKSLIEVLQADFFKAIRARQPYSPNLLRPCMIIDVPQVLREAVSQCGADPTHAGVGIVLQDLADRLDANA